MRRSRPRFNDGGFPMSRRMLLASACLGLMSVVSANALGQGQAATITVHADKPGIAISPTLHGIFFEDINYGADGGLYAELVQNRSFEHAEALFGWSEVKHGLGGSVTVLKEGGLNANNP